MSQWRKNLGDNLTQEINTYLDLLAAHDTVHPDRGTCGGVGRCLMLRTECEQEDVITGMLARTASAGVRIRVEVNTND